jgi:primosomal protein N' (replication factor Y)
MANFYSFDIDVAVALPVYNTFTYSVPETFRSRATAGKRVLVPFGNRKVTGYILGPRKNGTQTEIKSILDVLDGEPLFPVSMIPFFRWVADYYLHPIGEVIKSALPGGLTVYDFDSIAVTRIGMEVLKRKTASALEIKVLNVLSQKPRPIKTLSKDLHQEIPGTLIHHMQTKGWVSKKRELKADSTRIKTERFVSLAHPDLPISKHATARRKIIEVLKSIDEISVKDLKTRIPSAPRLIKYLEDDGHISVYKKNVYRDPFGEAVTPDVPPLLTHDQQNATRKVADSLGKGFKTFLLAGVTGSGKTEVYMQLAAESINRGYSVLILIPEIALISQMERRFRARFGADFQPVSAMISGCVS